MACRYVGWRRSDVRRVQRVVSTSASGLPPLIGLEIVLVEDKSSIDHPMEAFFRRFEAESAAGATETLAALYAPAFLMAGPTGAQVVKATDLALAIPKRRQLFASAGCRSTELLSVEETRLDDRYSLVRTEWRWTFTRSGEPVVITQPSSFLVDRVAEGGKIVCYINHADVVGAMRMHGLLPA